ncbi:hypothetical protein ACFQ34_18540 [Pseudonocardia benzenivorans]|uniref:ATP-grasp domain-containing protein n=1 Tax=Pseudonocardia benzenivorans TaxID=228005 RepID=A0ABW3VJP4_9PSEU
MIDAVLLHPNDGCLTVARELTRRGVRVHALATPEYAHVTRSRGVRGEVMPDIREHPRAWLDALAGVDDGVLICGSDAASEWVVRHRARIPARLRSFEAPGGAHLDLMDKRTTYRIAAEAGVRAPWMHHVADRADLDDLLGELTYPCVLKPTLGHVAKELVGVGTVHIASRADALAHAVPLLDLGVPILFTELVPGPETLLEGAVMVRDHDGGYPLSYGRRKLRQWPMDYGVGSLTEAVPVPETVALTRRLLDHTGYVGLAACETKRHAGTGELYLIEVNVRVPGNFGLAQACGVEGPWRLYATLAGLPVGPQRAQVDGRKVVLPVKDAQAVIARVRRGETTYGRAARSLRGTRDFGAFAARDPLPALHQLASTLLKARGRVGRPSAAPVAVDVRAPLSPPLVRTACSPGGGRPS